MGYRLTLSPHTHKVVFQSCVSVLSWRTHSCHCTVHWQCWTRTHFWPCIFSSHQRSDKISYYFNQMKCGQSHLVVTDTRSLKHLRSTHLPKKLHVSIKLTSLTQCAHNHECLLSRVGPRMFVDIDLYGRCSTTMNPTCSSILKTRES